jgi:hypothetical protein
MEQAAAWRELFRAGELLLGGNFKDGFAAYEARFQTGHLPPLDLPPIPLWRGENLAGRTILARGEQGLGDAIQFVRYLPLLRERGARILLAVEPVLHTLFEGLESAADLLPARGAIPRADFHIPLMSLPHRFGTTLETIPATVPYLAPPADLSAKLKRRPRTRLAVGIAWAGDPKHHNDAKRSIPFRELTVLADLPGVEIYSLQVGTRRADLADEAQRIHDVGRELSDFSRTAAVIADLDLIVTVDTAIAHLAGAMGRRCFVLLPHVADWRWLREREDSPWYPTLRLFRQATPGDWAGVMRRVCAAISEEPL